ncbi:MAG: HNH endonuclease [Planctomycetota bacterium]
MIRRCFREQIDRSPTKSQVGSIWDYFQNSCAYCGRTLDRDKKEGHIDHLVSASQGGANNISNRVLSCAACNEKEKLDEDWRAFLEKRVPDSGLRQKRIKKIEQWVVTQDAGSATVPEGLLRQAESLAEVAVKVFDSGIEKIRSVRQTSEK